MIPGLPKQNYLNNKDLLEEIHKSKCSYCDFTEAKYSQYDVIVDALEDIFLPETIELARQNKASKIAATQHKSELSKFKKDSLEEKPKIAKFYVDPESFSIDELVFRVMTHDHIPFAPGRKKNPKRTSDHYAKLNFPPFIHVIISDQAQKTHSVVGKSHHYKGEFCVTKGSITNNLAMMFIMLVDKYGQRSNWRGYSYLEEMKGQALIQLTQMSLQFNEAKSENPFSYMTQSVTNSFTRVLNSEKRHQQVRDDLLQHAGMNPSFSRQMAHEDEVRRARESQSDEN